MEKHHYLGYHQGAGEQLKYLIYLNDRIKHALVLGVQHIRFPVEISILAGMKGRKPKTSKKLSTTAVF